MSKSYKEFVNYSCPKCGSKEYKSVRYLHWPKVLEVDCICTYSELYKTKDYQEEKKVKRI
ncbi:MAG: hypothetical protein ACXACY_28680 [Candidatus Hodarchaeales archaeon]|jgi:predicted nucleic-acid-binding Zn-ribbon protein